MTVNEMLLEWRRCFDRVSCDVPYSDEKPLRDELRHADTVINALEAEISTLKTDRDSWRRVCERLESEKQREHVIGDDGGTYVSFSEPCATR